MSQSRNSLLTFSWDGESLRRESRPAPPPLFSSCLCAKGCSSEKPRLPFPGRRQRRPQEGGPRRGPKRSERGNEGMWQDSESPLLCAFCPGPSERLMMAVVTLDLLREMMWFFRFFADVGSTMIGWQGDAPSVAVGGFAAGPAVAALGAPARGTVPRGPWGPITSCFFPVHLSPGSAACAGPPFPECR